MSINLLPTIDGHFWIERDGKIVDTYFKGYDYVKKVNNLTGEMVYKEADDTTQKIMIMMFRKSLAKAGMSEDEYVALKKLLGMNKPAEDDCYFNCLLELKEGDMLKFGSMGWNKKNGSGVWWEYGGEDWSGVSAFLK
jgi:hypothetical protein